MRDTSETRVNVTLELSCTIDTILLVDFWKALATVALFELVEEACI